MRRIIKPGEDFKITLEDRISWRIYNMPVDLANQYISYAKIRFGNDVWKVMEYGMNLILEHDTNAREMKQRVEDLEREVQILKSLVNKDKGNGTTTFGGNDGT